MRRGDLYGWGRGLYTQDVECGIVVFQRAHYHRNNQELVVPCLGLTHDFIERREEKAGRNGGFSSTGLP